MRNSTLQLSDSALAVLSQCEVHGSTVRIVGPQLQRKLYEEVNFALAGIGGKWNRSAKAHVFAEPEEEVREMLEGCIQTGIAEPMTRNGYFPTPSAIADRVIELATLDTGTPLYILEPSAGSGNLIDALMSSTHRKNIASLDAIENDPKRYQALVGKYSDQAWLHPYPMDFLEWVPGRIYDRIVMNPPFGKLVDIDHVTHAYELLKPNGILVSVMSHSVEFRSESKAVEFRELVEDNGFFEPIPEKAFKESGTLTRTVIAVLGA